LRHLPSDPDALWRDPAQVASLWNEATDVDPRFLRHRVLGDWWDLLADLNVQLVVTREYEHLLVTIGVDERRLPSQSFFPIPHPSGLALRGDTLFVASTRNPNQVFEFKAVAGDGPWATDGAPTMVPVRSTMLPGRFYLHDLAFVGGVLHANAVGLNSVVRLEEALRGGTPSVVWWPRCVEVNGRAVTDRNYIQLNSIAAGESLETSCFSATADRMSTRRPGHRNFPVDKRGVIFAGKTGEPVLRGLTRPHTARFHGGRLWVDNSGYGEVGFAEGQQFVALAKLPGWTRGLAFHRDVVFVGTSKVIPRFYRYAPGLDLAGSCCGVCAVDVRSGRTLGAIVWPDGNQIFAVEAVSDKARARFPYRVGHKREDPRSLFYSFRTREGGELFDD